MTVPADARSTLHALIDAMTADEVEDLLDYLNMLAGPDGLTPEEEREVRKAMDSIEAGDFVTQAEVEKQFGFGA